MGKVINIRNELAPGDIGAIIKLHGEYYARNNGFNYTFEPYVAIPLSEFVMNKKESESIWIVEKEGEVKGSIAIVDHGNNVAQLRWYLLDESIQGFGIGKELIDKAISFVMENHYSAIILWTIDEQKKAIEIYKKNGFQKVEEKRHVMWGKEVNEECYEKVIGAKT